MAMMTQALSDSASANGIGSNQFAYDLGTAVGSLAGGYIGGASGYQAGRSGAVGRFLADEGGSVPASQGGGGSAQSGYTRVGRWMSQAEYEAMVSQGKVQSNTNNGLDMKHVTVPPDPSAYAAADSGSVFVQFDVPTSQLAQGGKAGWGIVYGPNSIHGRLAAQKGSPVSGMPDACNISVTGRK